MLVFKYDTHIFTHMTDAMMRLTNLSFQIRRTHIHHSVVVFGTGISNILNLDSESFFHCHLTYQMGHKLNIFLQHTYGK